MCLGQAVLVKLGCHGRLVMSVHGLSVDGGPLEGGVLVRDARFGGRIGAAVLQAEFCLHVDAYKLDQTVSKVSMSGVVNPPRGSDRLKPFSSRTLSSKEFL